MIETKNLTKIYNPGTPREVIAAKAVSVRIDYGTITIIRGPSGSGKTTLLSMLGLILAPSSGKILIDGEDVTRFSEHWKTLYRRENMGFIFQHINLLPGYTAMENVLIPLLCLDEEVSKYKNETLKLFRKLKIEERANNLVEQLSGGEQQRVSLVRALIRNPKIILADEPTVFVDKETSEIIFEMFRELRDEGKIIVVSTHDPRLIEIANRVYTMEKGTIIREQTQGKGI
ncbi:TPA: ABC transporter ATP-binding protein [Candidatus Bathyarchaeota archaeon]|nr:ABC transporter ATP-binding protein [Candidatus Bathyarchaeota archaeon]